MAGLESFEPGMNVAVIGASGGLGGAFVRALARSERVAAVLALSRRPIAPPSAKVQAVPIDLDDEGRIEAAAAEAVGRGLDLVVVATGLLHAGEALRPEKTWRQLDAAALMRVYRANAVGPALAAKHFLPLLPRDRKAAFAAISARVGSIGDNGLGGWHAYRASKAALNMLLKNFAVELARTRPGALCVGLHPGTVDTALSRPFRAGVPEGRLFTPDRSAGHLLDVLDRLGPGDSGGLFAWDGERIPY